MVAVVMPATAVSTVTVGTWFHVERVRRDVVPPLMPTVLPAMAAVLMVMVTVPMAARPMRLVAVCAEIEIDSVEESRSEPVKDHFPLVALLMVPAAAVLALPAERRMNDHGEHRHGCNCRQFRSLHLFISLCVSPRISPSSPGPLRGPSNCSPRVLMCTTVAASRNALVSACASFCNALLRYGTALRFVTENSSRTPDGVLHCRA